MTILIKDASGSDRRESVKENMEQSPGYREGIEDSIRRCEELLALTPLAFETSASGVRRGYAVKEADVELSKEALGNPKEDDSSTSSAEKLWKRNMELLSSGTARSHEKFDCKSEFCTDVNKREDRTSSDWSESMSVQQTLSPNKSTTKNSNSFVNRTAGCGHRYEWESEWSGASSEWNADRMCQGPNQTSESQVEDSAHSSEKSIANNKTNGRLHTLCSIDPQTVRDSQIDDPRQSKESDLSTKDSRDTREVISVRISDPIVRELPDRTCPCNAKPDLKDESISFYGKHPQCSSADCLYSETEVNGPPSQFHIACSQQESSSELLQASTPDGSGVSQVALDATWDTSDRPTSPESEEKTDTTLSSRSEQNMQHGHFHRLQQQSFQDKGRSKSVPKEVPRVNKLAKHRRSKSVFRERFEDRLQTLARPRTEVYKKLAELKAILEREKLRQCSFKPLVGRRPDPESLHSAPIFERIMEIQQRLELRKRARKAYEKEELDNCSFWPRINWRSQVFDKITYQPIQDRFQELQRQKFEKIANAQLRKDMGLTFKPEINQKSIQLCKQKGLETVHVAERLSAMQPSVHLDCKLEPQKNQSTFAPEINKNTDYIIASSRQFGGGSIGFLDRQKQYMQTVQEKKKTKEHGTPLDLTFRPDIGNSALILKQSHGQDVLQETPVERFERLAYKDKEQLWHARDKVSQAYYAQFHFQPEIDGFSRILARNNSVYDLYKNEKGRKVKEALEQAAQSEFQQKCPFRPEVNSTARRNGDVQLQSIIIQRRQLRKEKANSEQESRTLRELQELKECTFKPSVNPSPPKETAPAIIKGLERHLELQCIAKQMRREQEELERKVFFSHAYALPMRQYTIPRPFVLQTAQGRCNRRI